MVSSHVEERGAGALDEIDRYVEAVPPARRDACTRLVDVVRDHLDPRFAATINYGMPTWVVPHDVYPEGYHVDPTLGVPFISVANQRSHIAYYHMGIAHDAPTLEWFRREFERTGATLNMGRSCIRFTNLARIPFDLMAELTHRIDVDEFVAIYERSMRR